MKSCNKQTNTLLKRVSSLFLSILLLIPICVAVSYVGVCNGANISAEQEVRPGYSYNVRLVMDSATTGYEGYFSYDTSVLTLTRVVPVNSNLYVDFQVTTETGYVRVTHSEPVRQMLQLTFFVDETAKIGSEASIRFHSGYSIDGDNKEKVDDDTFRFKIVERKSSDATLKSLGVSVYRTSADRQSDENGFFASLVPSFSSSQLTYSMTVANEFAFLHVNALTNDSTAVVTTDLDGELTEGEINTVDVTVRAEDGTEKTYTLQIFRERMPEISVDISYVEPEDSSEEESYEEESSDEESSEAPSEDSLEPSDPPSEGADVVSEESVVTDDSSAGESDMDSSVFSSSEESSFASSLSRTESLSNGLSKTKNWNGIFFCIFALGATAIAVLLIRVLVLVYKKRHRSN